VGDGTGLTNQVVPLGDLLGASAHELTHRLREASTWDERFAIIDEEIEKRFADLAAQCGYFDQAHFSRDVHQFAGVSPTALVQSQIPDQGGFQIDLDAAGR